MELAAARNHVVARFDLIRAADVAEPVIPTVSETSVPMLFVLIGSASSSSLVTTVCRRTFVDVHDRARAGHGDRFRDSPGRSSASTLAVNPADS